MCNMTVSINLGYFCLETQQARDSPSENIFSFLLYKILTVILLGFSVRMSVLLLKRPSGGRQIFLFVFIPSKVNLLNYLIAPFSCKFQSIWAVYKVGLRQYFKLFSFPDSLIIVYLGKDRPNATTFVNAKSRFCSLSTAEATV